MAPYLAVRLTVVMLVSTGAPLVYANGSFCRASGYPRLEVLGRNCRFLQGPETECGAVAYDIYKNEYHGGLRSPHERPGDLVVGVAGRGM